MPAPVCCSKQLRNLLDPRPPVSPFIPPHIPKQSGETQRRVYLVPSSIHRRALIAWDKYSGGLDCLVTGCIGTRDRNGVGTSTASTSAFCSQTHVMIVDDLPVRRSITVASSIQRLITG